MSRHPPRRPAPSPSPIPSVLVLATAVLGAAACSGEPPLPGCPVQRLTWAARFELVPGQHVSGACARKAGEQLGVQTYQVPGSSQTTLALKPRTLARLDAVDPVSPGFSLGAFSEDAGPDDFCVATSLSVAEKHVPGSGGNPARDLVYRWTEVKILSRPDAPGSQLVATVEYTEDGCTATYEVWGVWPSLSCRGEDGSPDDRLCDTTAHGMNPDFALACDPTQLRCVPARRPPSFK
ncbi:MAG TPA: hypothetical protein VK447_20930 [Myxococcaceae bacterium]|nr:hypothetical protein [Myxococcaceae bacterium]